MKTYELNVISAYIKNFFILAGIFTGALVFIALLMTKTFGLLGLLMDLILGIAGILLGKKLCKAKASFTIQDKSLSIKWLENFKVWPKEDLIMNFSDIEEYVIDFTAEIFILKIKKTDWTKIELAFEIGKDSEAAAIFLDDFEKAMQYKHIKTGKNMWQSTSVKMMAPILIITLIWSWNHCWPGVLDAISWHDCIFIYWFGVCVSHLSL